MDQLLVEIKAKMLLTDAMKLMELLERSDDEDLKSYMESFEASIKDNINSPLRGCPFCGSDVKASIMPSLVSKKEMWRVHCENEKCAVYPSTPLCKEKEDAMGIWNGTRK